jgi:hypothetical protein
VLCFCCFKNESLIFLKFECDAPTSVDTTSDISVYGRAVKAFEGYVQIAKAT